MRIGWVSVFIDLPADRFDVGASFWQSVCHGTRTPPGGDQGEFVGFRPPSGDAHIGVQRIDVGRPRVHLDLHVGDVDAAATSVVAAGAAEVERIDDWVVLRSPAGVDFCVVPLERHHTVPDPVSDPALHRIDQLCLDVPALVFDAECDFWHRITGWPRSGGVIHGFCVLDRPDDLPVRLVVQRLGHDDDLGPRCHLDIACDGHRDALEAAHVQLGAELVARHERWTTLRDPAGLPYCLTARDPVTGRLPG